MKKNNQVILGTRGSKLARLQTMLVKDALVKQFPNFQVEIRVIKTTGDTVQDVPLSQIGDKGLFTKQLEAALVNEEIDIAVHSLKDMPAKEGEGLTISGVLKREDPRDALVLAKKPAGVDGPKDDLLRPGMVVGTSSLRRKALLKYIYPAITVESIRGNVDTRLKKLDEGKYDAVVLAAAGLIRSGLSSRISRSLDPEKFVPSGCQGIIGLETRIGDGGSGDGGIGALVEAITDSISLEAARAERQFLATLEGGCKTPVGCYAVINDGKKGEEMTITGMVAELDGSAVIQQSRTCSREDSVKTAHHLALEIKLAGGDAILEKIRSVERPDAVSDAGTEEHNREDHHRGYVVLVGAGPGDVGLFTIRGTEVLNRADVVIYDYLANEKLLEYCRESCEKIYVGKKAGAHTLSQDGINDLIIEKARAGNSVVRLKGGDPFVFGRGGEEALALREAGIEFEVVPGITAGVAAPAYAGIPVTHRKIAASVAFITGHEAEDKPESTIDWKGLANGADTLVFYMGVKNLPLIVQNLMTYGRAPETPVALIRWGCTPRQETITGTLDTIVEKSEKQGFKPPAVIMVGKVVGLRDTLRWFDKRPLFGKNIIVTRSRTQASKLTEALRAEGAGVEEFPTIEIQKMEDLTDLDREVGRLGSFSWIVFTSVNGVEIFFNRLYALSRDARHLSGVKVAVIGEATAEIVRDYGIDPDLVPERFTSEGTIEAFKEMRGAVAGAKVLIPGSEIARDYLPTHLTEMGAEVVQIPVYRNLKPHYTREQVEAVLSFSGAISSPVSGLVTFTSSSTVKNFVDILAEHGIQDRIKEIQGASIGPITTETARKFCVPILLEAETHTIPGLVEAIKTYYRGNQ